MFPKLKSRKSKKMSSSSCEEASQLLDGKAISLQVREEIKAKVEDLVQKYNCCPGLGVVLVGTRRDSQTYVRMKKKACSETGIQSFSCDLPESITEEELIEQVDLMNKNPNIHGILVQLPLPSHIDENKIINAIDFHKDVDGLHPLNMASLMMTRPRRQTSWLKTSSQFNVSCTPQGCMELLDRHSIPIEGKNAVIVGRSTIVGIPMSLLLLQRNATVTICHSKTVNLHEKVAQADILIAAVGQPELILGEWIKPGAVVIDVGINSVDDSSKKCGYRLVGDVQFDQAKKQASWITPVPGGVGPMTIAMLLFNTVKSAELSLKKSS